MAGLEIAGLDLPVLAALALLGLTGGIGITALGPGGVLPTIGLFALTDLSPTVVAGTAIVTHIATGLLATGAYARSGELREPATLRVAGLLAATAVVGTPLGVRLNTLVSPRVFGVLLAALLVLVAALVWYRDRGAPVPTAPARLRHRAYRRWASACRWRAASSASAAPCWPCRCSSPRQHPCSPRWPPPRPNPS